jgi:spermidine synthase
MQTQVTIRTPTSTSLIRRVLFLLFFLSGFASLVYQVVWTRMAFASFGIITPVLSTVLSVFMLGLGAGSLAGGAFIGPLVRKTNLSAAYFYGLTELIIGIGAFAVPYLFAFSARLLLPTGAMNSSAYLGLSAIALAISILPWCFCMGTTFPFMMAYVREIAPDNAKSFSFLYLANVLGAMTGTFATAFALIELFGFHATLRIAAAGNFTIAVVSAVLGSRAPGVSDVKTGGETSFPAASKAETSFFINLVLFTTGFVSMAMEVVWSRAFTIVLKTQVYSFASIVFMYLLATFVGSLAYRTHLRLNKVLRLQSLFALLAIAGFIPVIINDTRIINQNTGYVFDVTSIAVILASICPLCGLLGYLTPRLIDDYSAGSPKRAGIAYAVNVLGCILGPLVAGYLLLPNMGQGRALILLSLPLCAFWLASAKSQPPIPRLATGVLAAGAFIWAAFYSFDFDAWVLRVLPGSEIRRDYVATVTSSGTYRERKSLLVNGFGMTSLTPITKFMAHIPIGLHEHRPKSILIICFGMGTTYRSALSWNINTTAVELVPSVVDAFGFYHADARQVRQNPHGHVVVDDGRRYLARCGKKFDIIIVDPPPPVEAAGSSLLFSREFYDLAKEHLEPDGILQMWDPDGPGPMTDAILRSIYESFPHVRLYLSCEGWGFHMLGSMQHIPSLSPEQVAAKMPPSARADLLEWSDTPNLAEYLSRVLNNQLPIILNLNPNIRITDDRPFNEYFILRQLRSRNPLQH